MAVTESKAGGRRPRLLRRLSRPGQTAGDARVSRRLSRRGQAAGGAGVMAVFLRWTFWRAVFHRGYVLASGPQRRPAPASAGPA